MIEIHNAATAVTVSALLCVIALAPSVAAEFTGGSGPMGAGTVTSYAEIRDDGEPAEIGVIFSPGALDGLPTERNNTSRCFDLDGDGKINETGECEGDYEANLDFPPEVVDRDDLPFVFAMVNWNPKGHPPEAWLLPHFDIHFYWVPLTEVNQIRVGSCGIFIDCEDFERAIKPVPEKHIHPEYISIQAALGRMGDHLIDSKTPEFGNPPQTFTRTLIFGAYDGRVIFHEVMATLDFMVYGIDNCAPIKQPQVWEKAGYYPDKFCFRHLPGGGMKVYLAEFSMREAG